MIKMDRLAKSLCDDKDYNSRAKSIALKHRLKTRELIRIFIEIYEKDGGVLSDSVDKFATDMYIEKENKKRSKKHGIT